MLLLVLHTCACASPCTTPHTSPSQPPSPPSHTPLHTHTLAGEFTKATTEKLRLEEKQRQARKDRKHADEEYTPLWFDLVGGPGELVRGADKKGEVAWSFNARYWQARQQRTWEGCPDIY